VFEKPVFSCFFFKFELFVPSELLGTHFHDLTSMTPDRQLMSFEQVEIQGGLIAPRVWNQKPTAVEQKELLSSTQIIQNSISNSPLAAWCHCPRLRFFLPDRFNC
jgi:hypothetical protein